MAEEKKQSSVSFKHYDTLLSNQYKPKESSKANQPVSKSQEKLPEFRHKYKIKLEFQRNKNSISDLQDALKQKGALTRRLLEQRKEYMLKSNSQDHGINAPQLHKSSSKRKTSEKTSQKQFQFRKKYQNNGPSLLQRQYPAKNENPYQEVANKKNLLEFQSKFKNLREEESSDSSNILSLQEKNLLIDRLTLENRKLLVEISKLKAKEQQLFSRERNRKHHFDQSSNNYHDYLYNRYN